MKTKMLVTIGVCVLALFLEGCAGLGGIGVEYTAPGQITQRNGYYRGHMTTKIVNASSGPITIDDPTTQAFLLKTTRGLAIPPGGVVRIADIFTTVTAVRNGKSCTKSPSDRRSIPPLPSFVAYGTNIPYTEDLAEFRDSDFNGTGPCPH